MAGRIPRTIKECAAYIDATDDYLQEVVLPLNGIRLGMVAQNITDWHTYRQTNDKLMVARGNKVTKSPDINDQVQVEKKKFIKFAQPLLDIIAASPNATTTDANIFNVVLVRKSPTHPTESITAKCYVLAEAIGGGTNKFKCRTLSDAKRASLTEGADSVQISWLIGDINTKAPDPDSGMTQAIFTKAAFLIKSGAKNAGLFLFCYFRWYNTKHPELAGPWTGLMIIPIPQ